MQFKNIFLGAALLALLLSSCADSHEKEIIPSAPAEEQACDLFRRRSRPTTVPVAYPVGYTVPSVVHYTVGYTPPPESSRPVYPVSYPTCPIYAPYGSYGFPVVYEQSVYYDPYAYGYYDSLWDPFWDPCWI